MVNMITNMNKLTLLSSYECYKIEDDHKKK